MDKTMYLFKHLLLIVNLLKGKGHKYIKRVPVGVDKKTGRTRYRYVYNVTHKVGGKHIDDHDNMKVNSKYMFHSESGQEVHVHVKKVNKDGSLVLMYDDGDKKGEEFTMSKKELAQKLREEHGIEEKFKEKREKVKRDLEIARKHGTDKQIKRLERELAGLSRGIDRKKELSNAEKDESTKEQETRKEDDMEKKEEVGKKEGLNDFLQSSMEITDKLRELKEKYSRSASYPRMKRELEKEQDILIQKRIEEMGYENELPMEEEILIGLLQNRKKRIKTVEAFMKKVKPFLDSLKEYGSEAKVNTPFERYDPNAPASTPKEFYAFVKDMQKVTEKKNKNKAYYSDKITVFGDGTVLHMNGYASTVGKVKTEGLTGKEDDIVGFIYTADNVKDLKKYINELKEESGFEDLQNELEALKGRFKAGQFYSRDEFDNAFKEAVGFSPVADIKGKNGTFSEEKKLLNIKKRALLSISRERTSNEDNFFSVGGEDKKELLKRLKALDSVIDEGVHLNVDDVKEKVEILHPRFKTPIMVLNHDTQDAIRTMNTGIDTGILISALESNKDSASFTQKKSSSPPPMIMLNKGSSYSYIMPTRIKDTVHR